MGSDERWVAVDGVAAHLGVGRDSVHRWGDKRGPFARKLGRLLRFKLAEVDACFQAGADGAPAAQRACSKHPSRKTARTGGTR